MANLAHTAEHLASKGRHGDTMLVHMNPLEVAWMDAQTPNGLTINPDTGQPEAFAFLLPMLAGAVAPGLMASLGLTGAGALLGSAALTGLTDYAVNKDAKSALTSGLLSFGLGGLGNAFKGTAGAASNITKGADGIRIAGGQIATPGLLAPTTGGLLSKMGTVGKAIQNPSVAMQAIKANPLTIGAPLAAGAALTAQGMMAPVPYATPPKQDEKYKGAYQLERFPGKREIVPYGGDYSTYGLNNPEHSFFNPNNDRMRAPQIFGMQGLGAYGMAGGGAVLGEGDGVSDSVPAIGPGERPIQLSDGEYVIPADVVSMLGHGSTNGGIRYLDQMIAKTRANPPREEKGAPPQRRAA